MTVHAKLLEVLVCPACKGPVTVVRLQDAAKAAFGADAPAAAPAVDAPPIALDCPQCKLRYPIVDEIPVMLIDQAQRI